ncbi:MAG TPA: hypothetical protein VI997_02570 [Candidatus Thermoplasmatota archaeon]|nr:hypothetical protein [Candidatus Thermoplasmatota archaeon]
MPVAWNPWALLGLAAMAISWAAAGVVYFTAPRRSANRRLALLLLVDGVTLGCWMGLADMMRDEFDAFRWYIVGYAAMAAASPLYLSFLGTLDVGIARPFRSASTVRVLGAVSLLAAGGVVLFGGSFVALIPDGLGGWFDTNEPGSFVVVAPYILSAVYGLAASIVAFRATRPGSVARGRARAYAFAFGTRDSSYVVLGVGATAALYTTPLDPEIAAAVVTLALPTVQMVFVGLLAYGILKTQLFDVDLRLRRGIRRGTVGAIFLAVFFVVAQVAQTFLTDAFGYAVGGVVAGLLLFALAPLQHLAERVAAAATPGATALASLAPDDRVALYREQAVAAWEDGAIDRSERRLLDVARERLGLTVDEAARIEREAAGA